MPRPTKEPRLGKRGESPNWYILWNDGRRDRRTPTNTADVKHARRALADFLIRSQEPTSLRRPDEVTIADALRLYVKKILDKPAAKPAGTRAKQLIGYFRNNTLDAITPQSSTAYSAHRRAAGATTWTIIGEKSVLRAAINRMVKDGELTRSPFVPIESTPPDKDLWLDTWEIDLLVDNCVEAHVLLFVELALFTASRKQAILDMRWIGQIDFDAGIIHLNPRGRAQTSKRRPPIPMSDRIASLLGEAQKTAKSPYVIEYKGEHVGDIKVGFGAACRRARRAALRQARGLPIGARSAWLLAAAKFKRVTPHTLRHTAGSWIMQGTGEIGDTGSWLGHSNERTSRIYAHHDPRYMRRISDTIEQRRAGGLPPMAGNSPSGPRRK